MNFKVLTFALPVVIAFGLSVHADNTSPNYQEPPPGGVVEEGGGARPIGPVEGDPYYYREVAPPGPPVAAPIPIPNRCPGFIDDFGNCIVPIPLFNGFPPDRFYICGPGILCPLLPNYDVTCLPYQVQLDNQLIWLRRGGRMWGGGGWVNQPGLINIDPRIGRPGGYFSGGGAPLAVTPGGGYGYGGGRVFVGPGGLRGGDPRRMHGHP